MNNYEEIKKLYDESYLYIDEFKQYDDDFTFWEYWVNKLKPKTILEIGIGNGRLIKLLSIKVEEYDAIDISKNLIDDFNKKNIIKNVHIYNQDMKNININKKYDLIIIPFNTFSYLYTLDDLIKLFNGLTQISNKNTNIIFDIINPKIDDLRNQNNYKLCNTFLIGEEQYKLYEKHTYKIKEQVIVYSKKYINKNKKIKLNLPVRVFFPQEIDNLINNLNYRILYKIGDYNNELYDSNSRKQIFIISR